MTSIVKTSLAFGTIGVGIAVLLAETAQHSLVSNTLLITLWPTSLFGFGFNGPTFSPLGLFIATIELGGNFLIYAVMGFFVANLVSWIGRKV
jgi:hypothetical protein